MPETPSATSPTAVRNSRRKLWLSQLAIVFIAAGLIYFFYWLVVSRFYETTDDAYVSGNLVAVMPQISGQVNAILADNTDLVTKGKPLVLLNKIDAEIALQNAESQLALTARQISQLYQNVAQLQANVLVQQTNLKQAREDYDRRKKLQVNETITIEDLRHSKLAADNTVDALTLAKKQLAAAIDLVKNIDLYHHPAIQKAATDLRTAYLNLRRTVIYAPESGYVANRSVEVGQQVDSAKTLMVIVPLNQIWVNANFKESQLKHIRIGQPAEIDSDKYGDLIKFHATVVGLSPGTGSTFDLLPPQNATGNWIKIVQRLPVRLVIDPQQLKKYPLAVGLSMTVTVNTHHREGLQLAQTSQNKIIYETQDFSADLKEADQIIATILQSNAKNISL